VNGALTVTGQDTATRGGKKMRLQMNFFIARNEGNESACKFEGATLLQMGGGVHVPLKGGGPT